MNYRIIITYVALLGIFGFLAFAYVNYHQSQTPVNSPLLSKPVSTPSYLTKEQAEDLIKTIIKDNPEIIIRSIQDFQSIKRKEAIEQAKKRVLQHLTSIENNVDDPRIGDPNAKVKIVEFFDYDCGYCKQMAAIKAKIVEENPDIQYVFKEYPILGESSVLKAKAALAVYSIDKEKYMQFHLALLSSTEIKNEEHIIEVAGTLGIDIEKLRASFHNTKWNDIINANMNLAREIGIMGTPGYVIGGELYPGALSYEEIKVKINAARIRLGVAEPVVETTQTLHSNTNPPAPIAAHPSENEQQSSEPMAAADNAPEATVVAPSSVEGEKQTSEVAAASQGSVAVPTIESRNQRIESTANTATEGAVAAPLAESDKQVAKPVAVVPVVNPPVPNGEGN